MAERGKVNRKSLVGERFGKLTVAEMIYGEYVGKRKRTKCKCVCDCGNEVVVTTDSLQASRTSCGCDVKRRRVEAIRKDLTGLRFNRLVVEEMLWDYRPTKAVCRCDCGNSVTVIGTGLTSGKTGSCGCLHREKASVGATKDWTGIISPYGVEFLRQAYTNKKGQWLWFCKCGVCNKEFVALPAKIMNGHTTSCGCRKRSSREDLIRSFLDASGVTYSEQYRFPDCKDKYTLPFDFAILSDQPVVALIEYDGRQHYESVDYFGGQSGFKDTVRRDKIKDSYCQKNNINLLRLPYTLTDLEIKNRLLDIIYP